jgi:hypothetical protein
MEDFLGWLTKFNSSTVIVILCLILLITLLLKVQNFKDVFKWLFKKRLSRTCGDCILILFGFREKYETEAWDVEKNILKSQMTYFEQKLKELTLWFIQSFQDDLKLLGEGRPPSLKLSQFGNYQEALKNAMEAVQDEVRRSFKENGFVDMSDAEFSMYVRSKTKTLISIAQGYLATFYIQTEDIIVPLRYRYDKLDIHKLEEMAFDVFNYAKNISKEAIEKEQKLKYQFKNDIDKFTSGEGNR